MERLRKFEQEIKAKSDKFFAKVDGPIKVVSHLDADGLSAAAIVIEVLRHLKKSFTLRIASTIDADSIPEYIAPKDKHVILTDLGSGQIELLKGKGMNILVLDHHEIGGEAADIFHVNPRMHGIDGTEEISGAGVTYYWARQFMDAGRLSKLALIGAIGDVQAARAFASVNKEILKDAEAAKVIEKRKTPRFYGSHTKSLVHCLANSDIEIPGIRNNPGAAERFIMDLGITPTIGENPVKLCDLTTMEFDMLTQAIIQKRGDREDAADIYWESYLICGEEDGTFARDARELATLLNACGRLNKPSIGIGLLLGDENCRELAQVLADAYKKKIVEAIRWYRTNRNSDHVSEADNMIIINAQDNVPGTMIGTLASMISNEKDITQGTYILSLAHVEKDKTKVSLRISGRDSGSDLSGIVREVVEKVGEGQAGGHSMAAGAVIKREHEQKFMEAAKEVLTRTVKECL